MRGYVSVASVVGQADLRWDKGHSSETHEAMAALAEHMTVTIGFYYVPRLSKGTKLCGEE